MDLRCPKNPSRLLAKVSGDGQSLIEIACRDCRARTRREGRAVSLVLHVFMSNGVLVETFEVDTDTARRG